MKTNHKKENNKFDRKIGSLLLFILAPLFVVAIILFPTIEIAFGLWSGFSLIVLGYLSIKHSVVFGDYFIFHWRGKTSRFWAIFNIFIGFIIVSSVIIFNYFANK